MKNKRKVKGALVWHNNDLKRISSQDVGDKYCILDNLIKVEKSKIRLAKLGDEVKYKESSLIDLPERCSKLTSMKITYFLENGLVGTDKDLYLTSDSTNYNYFTRK